MLSLAELHINTAQQPQKPRDDSKQCLQIAAASREALSEQSEQPSRAGLACHKEKA